ncbi:hypothetical protein PFISCL1PPCAC_16210, partial [Pristionchus fissidentatus]
MYRTLLHFRSIDLVEGGLEGEGVVDGDEGEEHSDGLRRDRPLAGESLVVVGDRSKRLGRVVLLVGGESLLVKDGDIDRLRESISVLEEDRHLEVVGGLSGGNAVDLAVAHGVQLQDLGRVGAGDGELADDGGLEVEESIGSRVGALGRDLGRLALGCRSGGEKSCGREGNQKGRHHLH